MEISMKRGWIWLFVGLSACVSCVLKGNKIGVKWNNTEN